MPKEFDPYFEWLKIPPSEQPPNHYRLLNTARFESDPKLIESAVSRLVAKLQNLSNGQHVAHAQRILNDVAKARLCLSDLKEKATYDSQLRQKLGFHGLGADDLNSAQTLIESSNSVGQLNSTSNTTSAKPPANQTKAGKPAIKSSSLKTAPPKPKKSVPTKTTSSKVARSTARSKSKNKSKSKTKSKTANGLLIGYGVAILAVAGLAVFFLTQKLSGPREVAVVENESDIETAPTPPIEKPIVNSAKQPLDLDDSKPDQVEPANDSANDGLDKRASNFETTPPTESNHLSGDKTTISMPIPDAPIQNPAVPETTATETPANTPPATETSGDFSPDQKALFETMEGQFVHVSGVVAGTNQSGTGKTRYLRFTPDPNDSIMVYMLVSDVGEELSDEVLQGFVGKKIRVRGDLDRQFGTNRIGIRVKAKSQIEVID